VAPSRDSLADPKTVTSTSEDSAERVAIQQPLLADRMNAYITTAPAGGSVLQRNEVPGGSTDQSAAARNSVHEDECKCGEEAKDQGEARLHERVAKETEHDTVREEQVPLAAGRDSFDQKVVQEDEVGGKHRHHEISRGGDGITSVDKSDKRSDATAAVNEYSLDLAVCKTREQDVQSTIVSSSGSSASYEGLKIVVSLSNLTDEKHQSAISPEGAEVFLREGSLQQVKRSDNLKRKICKHKRMHNRRDRHGRSVVEQATVVTGRELEGFNNREPEAVGTDVMLQEGASKGGQDRRNMWKDVMIRNFPVDKDLSEVSTSYMSPPHQVLASSDIQNLEKLLGTEHKYQKTRLHAYEIDPWLAIYIPQLLAMRRRSVENLDVSSSDTSVPDVEINMAEETDREVQHEVIIYGTKRKQTTQDQTRTNLRSGPDAVEGLTNTVKEEMECKTYDVLVPRLQYETVSHMRQAVRMESVSSVTGASSCNELRQSIIEIRSSSAPGMLRASHQITCCDLCGRMSRPEGSERDASTHEQLHDLGQCSDNLCQINMKTPPFPSFISDMSLDEYKVFKFPEIFADYSEKCSERISNLTKKIEQIRGEKQKLIDCPGSSSSSASGSGFDSTKYLSPPESSTVIIHHKWHTNTDVRAQEAAAAARVRNADSGQQVSQNEETPQVSVCDGSETAMHQLQRLVPSHFLSFLFISTKIMVASQGSCESQWVKCTHVATAVSDDPLMKEQDSQPACVL
jgi:hypothetical protein